MKWSNNSIVMPLDVWGYTRSSIAVLIPFEQEIHVKVISLVCTDYVSAFEHTPRHQYRLAGLDPNLKNCNISTIGQDNHTCRW